MLSFKFPTSISLPLTHSIKIRIAVNLLAKSVLLLGLRRGFYDSKPVSINVHFVFPTEIKTVKRQRNTNEDQ